MVWAVGNDGEAARSKSAQGSPAADAPSSVAFDAGSLSPSALLWPGLARWGVWFVTEGYDDLARVRAGILSAKAASFLQQACRRVCALSPMCVYGCTHTQASSQALARTRGMWNHYADTLRPLQEAPSAPQGREAAGPCTPPQASSHAVRYTLPVYKHAVPHLPL